MQKEFKRLGVAAMLAIIPYLVLSPMSCTDTNDGQCQYPPFQWGLFLICTILVFVLLGVADYKDGEK